MKFGNMKKVLAVVMAAAMTVGSISAAPPVEVVAAGETPAISAQVALDKKGAKVTWNKLEDATVTGYRVYRTELDAEGNAVGSAQAISTLDAEGNSAKTWKFDFGSNKVVTESDGTEENNEISVSCLAEGYTSVSEENAYYSQAQGYGFTQGIPAAAGGTLVFSNRTDGKKMSEDVLNGDFATIQAPEGGVLTAGGLVEGQSYMEFVVDVPNGEYKVTATHSGLVTGRNISVFWFQGVKADRLPVNNAPAVSKRNVTVKDGKLKISASASASSGTVYPPALSAATITEIPKIKTGIDSTGDFYCNDVTVDLSKDYTYKVVAMKGDKEAADLNSGEIPTIPAPTVSVSETTKNSVKLAINNNELATGSYNIYRKKAEEASFTKVKELTNINEEGNYTASKVFGEKEVYKEDDFNSYTLGNGSNVKNLIAEENGDWTVLNPPADVTKQNYVGMIIDKSDAACANSFSMLDASVLGNYSGAFMYLAMAMDSATTFHKKLADAAALNGQTRLHLNFALPNYFTNNKDRGRCSNCLYLADKEITENDITSGYVAKLEYNADDNKIYLNDSEVYAFAENEDAVRSVWNTITLDINPETKQISYEFEREDEDYIKSGTVAIPVAAQEPAAREGEGESETPSYATLSFTSAKGIDYAQRWGSIAIDNLKFASLGEMDSQGRTYTYTDTNLAANTDYNYYVGAVVDGKEVVRSSAVNAKTQPIPVDSISLNPSTPIEMKKGDTIDVPAVIVSPDNASDPSVTWSSDDPTVATVVDDKIEGKNAGTTNIVATTKNGKKASCAVTVTDVSLDRTTLNIKIGEEKTLTATVKPASITNKSVTWKSDDENIATVDQEGNVKAIAVGRTKITVTAANNGETATCTVNVSKAAVTGITLNPTSGTVEKGATVTLSAKVAPDNATNKDLTWKSSNEKVATVANGVVKAVGKGTATITVTSLDNANVTATYSITVTETPAKVPATDIKIKSTKITLDLSVKSKKTAKISASLVPSNSTDSITYSVPKNCKVIKVDKNGKITALKAGSAKVTVKSTSGRTKTVNVTVKASATKVKIKGKGIKKNKVTLKKGKKLALTATISPKNSTDKAKWTTSKKKYVTIKKTKKGVTITAKKKGKSVITVKAGKKSAKITVTVK